MSTIYSFTEEQVEVLNQMMFADGLAQLGYIPASGGGTGMTNAKSSLAQDEIKSIVDKITDENAKTVCSYALARVGYLYSQTYRDSGNYYDCSSLAFYSWQSAGVNISYDGANYVVVEAVNEATGVVIFDYHNKNMVLIGRPNKK